MKISLYFKALLFGGALLTAKSAAADTLQVMTYNVLYYGDRPACQGPHSASHRYLRTIIAYTQPDIIGLEKMAAIPMYAGDMSGTAPTGFADSVLQYAFNAAYPGRYAYCTYTNTSGADNMDLLYYNQQKLGFSGILCSYPNITDFNTYKLYYKAADLALTHDTVFLYVTLNHDQSGSGSGSASTRAGQMAGEMAQIETHFTHLPNMVNMGDFNTHNSMESCYQTFVSPADTSYRYYDPPFYPDAVYSYPADWDSNPMDYAAALTTSTRLSSSIPNDCGSNGGGKSWYDHIFLSADIINNTQRIRYIPHSYRTIGNDGLRTGISVNDAPANTSAPDSVIQAIFQMSNKYPVMASLEVTPGVSGLGALQLVEDNIKVVNPAGNSLYIYATPATVGKDVTVQCYSMQGRLVMQYTFYSMAGREQLPCTLAPGTYYLRFTHEGTPIYRTMLTKQ